jgi:hypothetical protein
LEENENLLKSLITDFNFFRIRLVPFREEAGITQKNDQNEKKFENLKEEEEKDEKIN